MLALYGAFLAAKPDYYGLMDSVDLAIHEAGHPLFGIFGEFIGYAGGTLMQLLVPAVFLGYFWRRRDRHAGRHALVDRAEPLNSTSSRYIAGAPPSRSCRLVGTASTTACVDYLRREMG